MVVLLFAAIAAVAFAGCGGGDSTTSVGTTEGSSTTKQEGSEGGAAAIAEAKAEIKPLVGKPSPFPVDVPLEKEIPSGTKIGYVQCAAPACALGAESAVVAAEALGAELFIAKVPTESAQNVRDAFESVIAQHPDGVVIPAINPAIFKPQLEQLKSEDVKLVAGSNPEAAKYGVENELLGAAATEEWGRMFAASAVAEFGDEVNILFYTVPELTFTLIAEKAFSAKIEELCPKCNVTYEKLTLAEYGTTAPNTVVSNLQANPDTEVVMFADNGASTGVPAALESAGLEDVKLVGFAPQPPALQDIKEGKQAYALGVDFPTFNFEIFDLLARLINGEEPTKAEKLGQVPMQFLYQKDMTFDLSKGWSAYPNFAERFTELWHPKG